MFFFLKGHSSLLFNSSSTLNRDFAALVDMLEPAGGNALEVIILDTIYFAFELLNHYLHIASVPENLGWL